MSTSTCLWTWYLQKKYYKERTIRKILRVVRVPVLNVIMSLTQNAAVHIEVHTRSQQPSDVLAQVVQALGMAMVPHPPGATPRNCMQASHR